MIQNDMKFMMDDGLFVAARCEEIKENKDFQRCISLHSNFNSLGPVAKANWCLSIHEAETKKSNFHFLTQQQRIVHPANN